MGLGLGKGSFKERMFYRYRERKKMNINRIIRQKEEKLFLLSDERSILVRPLALYLHFFLTNFVRFPWTDALKYSSKNDIDGKV